MDCAGFNCLRELEHGDHLEVTAIEGPHISFTIANESSPFRRQKLAAHIHDVVVGGPRLEHHALHRFEQIISRVPSSLEG